MSEELVKDKIIRQTDSGLGVDARADPGGPSSPEALLIRTLPHDLVMGRMAQGFPRVLHELAMGGISRAGSRQSLTGLSRMLRKQKLSICALDPRGLSQPPTSLSCSRLVLCPEAGHLGKLGASLSLDTAP